MTEDMPVDDAPQPSSKFQQKLAERRAQQEAHRAANTSPWENYAEAHPEDIPQADTASSGVSPEQERVNEFFDRDTALDVYDHLMPPAKHKRQDPRGRTESVMARCPRPDHADKNPDAWFGIRDGEWMINCGPCSEGWNKTGLAALLLGIPNTPENYPTIRREYVKRVHGYDYEAERAKRTAPPMPAATVPDTPGRTHDATPTGAPLGGDAPDDDPYEKAVAEEVSRQLIYAEARERARQIRAAGSFSPPPVVTLDFELAQPDPQIEWTIEDLHPVGTNATITAGFKTGKSTLVKNLLKSLTDGEPFLEAHAVRRLEGRVAYLNYEIDRDMMRRDLRELGIAHPERALILPLRGERLDLMDDTAREWLTGQLKAHEVEVLIMDPFSGAYYGDENDNSQVAEWFKRVNEIKLNAGVKDLFLPVHTGRGVEEGRERARGASKIDDDPDVRWTLTRDDSDNRYLKAHGRRVEMDERQLAFDRSTGRLSYSGHGSRADAAKASIAQMILNLVGLKPGATTNDITSAVSGNATVVRNELKKLVNNLDIETRPGARNSTLHYLSGQAP